MITDTQSGTRIDEIASGIFRISIPLVDKIPGGFSFNHFLIAGEQPALFHTGYRQNFSLLRQAIATVLPLDRLRYIGYSHYEPDESGGVEQLLASAPEAKPFSSDVGVMVSLGGPFEVPSLGLTDGQQLDLGTHRLKWISTPHVPHGWDCGILFEEVTGTLLCGDLFTQGGASNPPITESDILGPSELFRKPMDYFANADKHNTDPREAGRPETSPPRLPARQFIPRGRSRPDPRTEPPARRRTDSLQSGGLVSASVKTSRPKLWKTL